jgi:hypothetical protein
MATQQQKNASDLGDQATALAEQLGRIAGTMEGTAEEWLKRPSLARQLMQVRDGAAQMLESLSKNALPGRGGKAQKRKKKEAGAAGAKARRADPAHAPGNGAEDQRRPRARKKSDESIPKLRTAQAVRQRRKSYA